MPTKITVVQFHKWGSALRSHSWAPALSIVACQRFGRHNSAALRWGMALSRFLRRFWSKSLGQPTSLYSSVNSGKKALISFLPPIHRPWKGLWKAIVEGNCKIAVSLQGTVNYCLFCLCLQTLRRNTHTKKLLCGFLERLRWNKYCLISLLLFV